MKVISVNIGEKKEVIYKDKLVTTGIFKKPVQHAIFLGIENVTNDAIIDRKNHGGINQAVYAYGKNHYAYWKTMYPDLDWHYGMFGENLTVSNLEETKIKVGSIYRLGGTMLEVTKPRTPCFKLGLVFKTQAILRQFWNSTKSGVHFKVLQTGKVKAGDKFMLVKEMNELPTIATVYQSKRNKKGF